MIDGVKPAVTEESHEFENLEKAQATQPQPTSPKTQEGFDIKDEFGKILETGQQALTGATDLAQIQQQQQDEVKQKQVDQKKLANVKQFLNQMAQDEQRFKQQKQEKEQKKIEEDQSEKKKKQEVEMKKQNKEQSFQEQHIKAEQTKTERKLGVGG